MTCEHTGSAELSGYADGGLADGEQRWWSEHVAACGDCREELERIVGLRNALRESLPRLQPSESFREVLRTRLREEATFVRSSTNGSSPIRVAVSPQRVRGSWWARWPVAVAASLLLITGFALGRLPGRPGPDPIAAEVVAGHLRSLEVDHLLDVTSSEHHVVRPWFTGKLDFAPPVPDLAADSFPLVGARVDFLAGRTVAALVYSHGPHRINLFVRPDPTTPSCTRDAPMVQQGFNLAHGHAAGMEFWAISDLNREELVDFATRWQRQAAPADATCR